MEKKFIELKADINPMDGTEGEKGFFEGFGSVFGNVDSYGDVVEKGAFEESLKRNGMPALLIQHNSSDIGGIYIAAEEKEDGLYLKGQLNLDVQKARESYSLMKQGALKGLSIGFIPQEVEYDRDADIRFIKKVDLLEVSLVTFPANREALITQVKSAPDNERDFERFLRANGYTRTEAKAITARGIKGYQDVLREADIKDIPCDALREADGLKEALLNLNQTLKELQDVGHNTRT